MADEQLPNGARRIVEDRRNPRTCVTANVIVRGKKKYFQVAHLNLFFEYIDDGTIGEQIKEPLDIWQPSIIPAPDPSAMDIVIIEYNQYYVSSDRRFFEYISSNRVGREVPEPYWEVAYSSLSPNSIRINTRQVKITETKEETMRLVAGNCLQRFEDFNFKVSYTVNSKKFANRLPINLTCVTFELKHMKTLPYLPESLLELNCCSIKLKTLPELPKQLQILKCNDNELLKLPDLPPSLESLYCDSNRLTSLPALPDSLRILSCESNPLRVLPSLLPDLYRLHCKNTEINCLPALPKSLGILDCSNNTLKVLPELPPTLDFLWCEHCHLTDLPTLPETLTRLDYSHNQVKGSVSIQAGICYYDCSFNPIDAITSIDLSGVPQNRRFPHGCQPVNRRTPLSLEKLLCFNTSIRTLPVLPDSLKSLDCSNTMLESLPRLPRNLTRLTCNGCPLKKLPPLPNTMTYLDCSNTQIRILPIIPLDPYRFFDNLQCSNTCLPPELMHYIADRDLESVNYYTYAQAHKEARKADIRDLVSLLFAMGKDSGECMTTQDKNELPADVVRLIAGYLTSPRVLAGRKSLVAAVCGVRADILAPIVLPENIV